MGGSVSFPRELLARDKVAIVTGGNTGIGYEVAKWIAMMGTKVIIACRSEVRAVQAIERMKQEFQEEKRRGTEGIIQDKDIDVEFMIADFASLQSVKAFVDNFITSGRKLHILVCNAGVVFHRQELTEDGNEMTFQVNYLGQFLLALHMTPVMERSGSDGCRIVLVSSWLHADAPAFDVSKIQGKQYTKDNFPRGDYYNYSKMYQIMQMYFMNRRLKDSNVAVLAMNPGWVNTESSRSFDDLCCFVCIVKMGACCHWSKPPFKGAETAVYAATTPSLKGVRDVYYVNCKPANTSNNSRNKEDQEALLKFSMDLLKDYLTDDFINRWSPNIETN